MPAPRVFPVVRSALELDGAHAGFLSSAEGGHAVGDVIAEAPSTPGIQSKRIGQVKYKDIIVTCGAGMSIAFWEVLQAVLRGDAPHLNGAIVAYDQDFTERWRLEFTEALITEVGFPKLDAGSKDAALLTVTLVPDHTRRRAGSGSKGPVPDSTKQKAFGQARFRVVIDGLPGASKAVSKVDALTVAVEPTGIEFPNLVVTVAQPAAQPLEIWHEDFVVAGNQREHAGTLDLLAPDMKEVLLSLTLSGLGIFELSYDRVEGATDRIANVAASMYCEQIALVTVPGKP